MVETKNACKIMTNIKKKKWKSSNKTQKNYQILTSCRLNRAPMKLNAWWRWCLTLRDKLQLQSNGNHVAKLGDPQESSLVVVQV